MTEKARNGRDAFTFSLRGLNTMASSGVAPVVADDRISRAAARQQVTDQQDQPDTGKELDATRGRFWLSRFLRAA